jgi:hypothetical protein
VPDVTINRCTLRIVRHGGWSWGAAPDTLLQSAIKILPELIARELGQFWTSEGADDDYEISAPVRISIPIHLNELLAIGGAGFHDSEFSYSSEFTVVGQRINSAVRAALIDKHVLAESVEESKITSRLSEEVVAGRRKSSESFVVAVLRTWQRQGVLAQRLSVFSTAALEAWHQYLVRTNDHQTVFGREQISSIGSMIEECLRLMPLGATAATREAILRRRLIAIAELMVRFDLVRCPAVVLSKLDEVIPVLATKRHTNHKKSAFATEADHDQADSIDSLNGETEGSGQTGKKSNDDVFHAMRDRHGFAASETELPAHDSDTAPRSISDADGLTVAREQSGSTAVEAESSSRRTAGNVTKSSTVRDAKHRHNVAVVQTKSSSRQTESSSRQTKSSSRQTESTARQTGSTARQTETSTSTSTKSGTPQPASTGSTSLQIQHSTGKAAKSVTSPHSAGSSTSTQTASTQLPLLRIMSRLRREASALPFLLLGPLARTGYLQTLAAVLEASENTAASPLFATALAYKVLPPPERGWRRSALTLATAAAFAALENPAAEPSLMQFAQAVAPHLSALDVTLSGALIAGHNSSAPLLLLATEEGLCLFDAEGIFPIQWANQPADLCSTLIQLDSSIVFVPRASAGVELLLWLTNEGLRFVTDAPPTRGENLRSIRRPPDLRWWTNDEATPDSVFAHLASSLPGAVEDALELVQALAKDRPAIPLARESALDRHLTLAAATALGTIAWDLWKEREQTAPTVALERFADLHAHVDYADDLVTVNLPLGKRFLDLRANGLLEDVHDVPWLDGRKLIFTSG